MLPVGNLVGFKNIDNIVLYTGVFVIKGFSGIWISLYQRLVLRYLLVTSAVNVACIWGNLVIINTAWLSWEMPEREETVGKIISCVLRTDLWSQMLSPWNLKCYFCVLSIVDRLVKRKSQQTISDPVWLRLVCQFLRTATFLKLDIFRPVTRVTVIKLACKCN